LQKKNNMRVYLDNAATTPVAPEVIEAMTPYLGEFFGNPSSTHYFGRQTKGAIEQARRNIAKLLGCTPAEIIFTSGGTEADNIAIATGILNLGVTRIITSAIEHHAVGHTAEAYCENGSIELCQIDLDSKGNIDMDQLKSLLEMKREGKTMVSFMHANNEIATLLPIKEVGDLCKLNGAYFHSDTVQTMGHYPFDLKNQNVDFITGAAHKFHGPKGIGFLYVNKALKATTLIHGGSQERGLRGGTENLMGIVGLSKALELAYTDLTEHQNHVQGLKTHMMAELKINFPDISFHGETDPQKSLYTVLNVCLPATPKSEMLLFTLDLKGVACSGGSACTAGANTGSHVLRGINADTTRPNVRFSFSRYTTKAEIDFAITQLISTYEIALV
jgi:cysteine desulfurase